MKYVLVQWSAGNIKTSILTENYVRDKSMLYDFTKEGIISFVTVQRGEVSVVKNKGKLGRIACVSDDRKVIEEHQNLLLAEENEFIEDDVSPPPRSNSSKRPRLDDQDQTEFNGENDLRSVAELSQKVSKLSEELSLEKEKVKELQNLNQTLQKRLPVLLQNAMQSSDVITQLRMCASCNNQSSDNIVEDTILPEPTVTTEDVPSTTDSIAKTTLSNTTSDQTTSQTIERSQTFTCPLNSTSISTPRTMISSPTMASIQSNVGSLNQPSTPDSDLVMTLPGMSTSGIHDTSTPKIPLAESLKIVPLCNCPESNGNTVSGQDKITNSIPLEISNAGTFRKMTLSMMNHFFDKEVLRESSVTGSGKGGRHSRPALDEQIIHYIIELVQKRFPGVASREIKATMAQKCKYLRLATTKSKAKTTQDKTDKE